MHQVIFSFLLVLRLVQPQREEELGEKIKNLDATEDREASEESHRSSDQSKSSNKGHLEIHFLLLILIIHNNSNILTVL